jgi:hypothetical protein
MGRKTQTLFEATALAWMDYWSIGLSGTTVWTPYGKTAKKIATQVLQGAVNMNKYNIHSTSRDRVES